jgi:multidrug resistance protein
LVFLPEYFVLKIKGATYLWPVKSRGLFILLFTVFIDLFGFGVVIPILPNYATRLSGSEVMAGAIVAIYALAQLIFNPIWGALSDKYGRRPVILASNFLNMSGFFLLGFADDIPTLLFSRLLSGIGSGNISAAQAFIADITPPEKRAKTMGLVGVAFSFGLIFGAPIGGQIFSHFGFPWLGWGTGILCALNLLLSIWILPESLKEKASHIKIVIFPVRQIWQTVLHDRGTGLLFLMGFSYAASFFLFQLAANLAWEQEKGLSMETIAWLFSVIGLSSGLTQGLAIGPLTKRFGELHLIRFGIGLFVSILLIYPWIPQGWMALEVILLAGLAFANGLINAPGLSLLSQRHDRQSQGRVIGYYQSVSASARVVGPLTAGLLYQIWFPLPFWTAAGLMSVTLFLLLRFWGPSPKVVAS